MREARPYQPYQLQQQGFLAHAWALLTHDRGWIKPVLLLTLVSFIPIVGPLGVLGYEVEWARLLAWGVEAVPKQKDVRLGGCIASGWRSFLVLLGWNVLGCCAILLLALVPLAGPILSFLGGLALFVVNALLPVAVLRASVYQRVGAGYKLDVLWDMLDRDRRGAARVAAVSIVGNLVVALVSGLIATSLVAGTVAGYLFYGPIDGSFVDAWMVAALLESVLAAAPALLLLAVADTLAKVVISMLSYGAAALFMRQFDVAAWGASADPLPDEWGDGAWGGQGDYARQHGQSVRQGAGGSYDANGWQGQPDAHDRETSSGEVPYYRQADDYVYEPYRGEVDDAGASSDDSES